MTVNGMDWRWNPERNYGAGGWDVFEAHNDEEENERLLNDFSRGLHDKDKGNVH